MQNLVPMISPFCNYEIVDVFDPTFIFYYTLIIEFSGGIYFTPILNTNVLSFLLSQYSYSTQLFYISYVLYKIFVKLNVVSDDVSQCKHRVKKLRKFIENLTYEIVEEESKNIDEEKDQEENQEEEDDNVKSNVATKTTGEYLYDDDDNNLVESENESLVYDPTDNLQVTGSDNLQVTDSDNLQVTGTDNLNINNTEVTGSDPSDSDVDSE